MSYRLLKFLIGFYFSLCSLDYAVSAETEEAVDSSRVIKAFSTLLLNPKAKEVVSNLSSYEGSYRRNGAICSTTQKAAANVCLEKKAPWLQEALGVVNMVSPQVTGMMEACSELKKAASTVASLLVAYQTACTSARSVCTISCKAAKTSAEKIKGINLDATTEWCDASQFAPDSVGQNAKASCESKALGHKQTLQGWVTAVVVRDLVEEDPSGITATLGSKNKACSYDYSMMVMSAVTGMQQMFSTVQEVSKCEQSLSSGVDKCLDAEVAKTDRECICRFNPRTAGCDSSLSSTSASQDLFKMNSAGIDKKKDNDIGPLDSSSNTDAGGGSAVGSSASAAAGAPTGGGGGFGASGGGSGSSGDGGASGSGAPLNAKIINGFSGGGGGAFGSRSSASSDAYRAYLPGGKKDPALNVGGQELWKKEVTGQGGKSNWDKVRDRYRDNRSSLIEN